MFRRFAKILVLPLLAAPFFHAFAATTITVDADKPSGTYDTPFEVRLSASDAAAKIWYTFNPNGSPGDALPYSRPIRIEKSTPLLFFAYTDTQHESKIERRDYVVLSPTTLRFERESLSIPSEASEISISVENFGDAPVRLSGWIVRTGAGKFAIDREVTLPGGAKTDFGPVAYSGGAAILSSPDGDILDTLPITREPPKVVEPPSVSIAKPPVRRAQTTSEPFAPPSSDHANAGTAETDVSAPSGAAVSAPPQPSELPNSSAPAETPTESATLPTPAPETGGTGDLPASEPVPSVVTPVEDVPDASMKLSAGEAAPFSDSAKKTAAIGIL